MAEYIPTTLPNGQAGYLLRHDNGLIEYIDAQGNVVGRNYDATMPLADPSTLTGESGLAIQQPSMAQPMRAPAPQRPAPSLPQSMGTSSPQAPVNPYDGRVVTNTPLSMPSLPAGAGGVPPPAPAFTSGFENAQPRGGYANIPTGGGVPTYADGSTHPRQGGQPRVPGGFWNAGGDEPSSRGWVVPEWGQGQQGGFWGERVSKGSVGTRSDAFRGDQGPNLNPRFAALRAKGDALAGKIRGMASDLRYGGGGPSYETQQQRQYERTGRQMDRAYADTAYDAAASPYSPYGTTAKPKMRGFSRKFNPEQAMGLYFRPSMALPRAVPRLEMTSPLYGTVSDLPAAQLALLSSGRKKIKENRQLSAYTNSLADFYRDAALRGDLPELGQMQRSLTNAHRKSPLGQMFADQPMGFGAQNYESMVTGMLSASGLDPRTAAAQAELAQRYIDQYGSRFVTRKPKKAPMINKYVGHRMGWG